ncbi:MAG: class II aldolase/adducin family protein [Candidatus Pelethousia sp.]|nr:class II aldolase/adducin family protein [Candidatus Pelethousia sp.]
MQERTAKAEVIAAGQELVTRGLVARTWGNVSCRIDENTFAITPSGIGYERLTPEMIVAVDIRTLAYAGEVKPSSEKGIHAAAYRLNPNVNFVIHTHQTYAACLSVSGYAALASTGAERDLLGGDILRTAYALPGTKALRRNVEAALAAGGNAILMERHGALLTGADRATAFARAVALEAVCRRAAPKIPLAAAEPPPIYSRRLDGDAFAISGIAEDGGERELRLREDGLAPVATLHAAIYRAYPAFAGIMHLSSEVLREAMEGTSALPAVLDDFAQLAGGDMKACGALSPADPQSAIRAAVRGLKGRNCVYIRGLGAIGCAATAEDCGAVLALSEKNALAYLNARASGPVDALPWLDRKLMRLIYTRKYSKRK